MKQFIFLWILLLLFVYVNDGIFIGRKTKKVKPNVVPPKEKKVNDGPINNHIKSNQRNDLDLDLSDNIIIREWEIAGPTEGATTKQNRIRKCKTQQYYKGIPIFGATLVMEEEDNSLSKNNMKAIFGKWYDKNLIDNNIKSTKTSISSQEAIEIAMKELNIDENQIIGLLTPKLYIYFDNKKNKNNENIAYLSWILRNIEYNGFDGLLMNAMLILNANNGDILSIYNKPIPSLVEACGTGGNEGTDEYKYCIDNRFPKLFIYDTTNLVLSNERFVIWDNNHESSSNIDRAELIKCIRRSGIESTKCDISDYAINGGRCVSCDAFVFSEATFNMYNDWMNEIYPVSDSAIPLNIYVHVGENWANAFWSPSRELMGFGDGDNTHYPYTRHDIVAHEIGHGFTDKGSDLIYDDESGGMNEAYSDIIGECLEYYLFNSIDWEHGSRYLYNPPLDGISIDHYSNYRSSMDVHHSSGIYNKAAYLLNTVYGWNIQEIFKIFSTANLNYWNTDSTFNEGVCALYPSLIDNYGSNTGMEQDIDNAFNEVGLKCPTRIINGGILCGENQYCFYKDIYPLNTASTIFSIIIRGQNNGKQSDYKIAITVKNNICINPTISVQYEEIDYNSKPNEYFRIYNGNNNNNNNVLIEECFGEQRQCEPNYEFKTCLENYKLSDLIQINNIYYIIISQGPNVNNLCSAKSDGADLTMNAILTINCAKPENPSPSSSPTTKTPTTKIPTTQSPTTKSPTSPTTKTPTNQSPTTKSPTNPSPTTKSPTSALPPTVFTCDNKDECKDTRLTCNPSICSIYCTGEASCSGNAILDGSKATSISIICSNKDSCKDAHFICPNSGICNIQCSGEKACDGATCEGTSCSSNFNAALIAEKKKVVDEMDNNNNQYHNDYDDDDDDDDDYDDLNIILTPFTWYNIIGIAIWINILICIWFYICCYKRKKRKKKIKHNINNQIDIDNQSL